MASIFKQMPLLRQAAPHLSKHFFTCQAPRHNLTQIASSTKHKSAITTLSGQKHRIATASSGSTLPHHNKVSPLSALANAIPNATTSIPGPENPSSSSSSSSSNTNSNTKSSFFPTHSSKSVAYWLLASAASVYGIVIFGGLTRLTESGLSITEWRPVTGSWPPTNPEAWESEFAKYRASPEYIRLNPRMNLEEFKSIYWMEWTHRLWGRLVGLTFVVPAAYFIARGRVSLPMTGAVSAIALGIGFQGFLGWWMVKSGLKDDLFAPGAHPRVSQYRLTAHLATAFTVYLGMLSSGVTILRTHAALKDPSAALNMIQRLQSSALRPFRLAVLALLALTFTTAMSGALVAGLDAGLIYNEFPYMGLGLTPPMKELFDHFYSRLPDQSDLWWRNALENPSLVQLDHRALATTTFTAVMALWAYARYGLGGKKVGAVIPRQVYRGVHGVVGFAWLQVVLGISTLIYLVPTPLASMHQARALALLSMVTILAGRTARSTRLVRLVKDAVARQSKVVGGKSPIVQVRSVKRS